jgi:formylglycine-generating enzyme required for sulfatase activity
MKMFAALLVGLTFLVSPLHAASEDWVPIKGGTFLMKTSRDMESEPVTVKPFMLFRTLVTEAQYEECVNSGGCTEPDTDGFKSGSCNFRMYGRENDPVNCVTWEQANAYALWKAAIPGFEGARLPSESEWVFAATDGGKNERLGASCDVGSAAGSHACGNGGTVPVCTYADWSVRVDEGRELCDMVGNVWQWVRRLQPDEAFQVLRGGSFYPKRGGYDAAVHRYVVAATDRFGDYGFRLAR